VRGRRRAAAFAASVVSEPVAGSFVPAVIVSREPGFPAALAPRRLVLTEGRRRAVEATGRADVL